jgi:2-iminoacetate synthase ThiH
MKRNNHAIIHTTSPLYCPLTEAECQANFRWNSILQATLKYCHNRCTFCGKYKSKRFCVRPIEELARDIELLSGQFPDSNKVFSTDGDDLSALSKYLAELLRLLKTHFQDSAACHSILLRKTFWRKAQRA